MVGATPYLSHVAQVDRACIVWAYGTTIPFVETRDDGATGNSVDLAHSNRTA